MNKKILLVVSIIIVIALTTSLAYGKLTSNEEQRHQIFYLTNKKEMDQKVGFNYRDKGGQAATVGSGLEIPPDFMKKADVLWVDLEYLEQEQNLVLIVNKIIDLNIPVIFIGESPERSEIIKLLNLKQTEAFEPKNTGEAILKGIRINRTSKGHYFTNIYIDKEMSADKEQEYSGIAAASYSEM